MIVTFNGKASNHGDFGNMSVQYMRRPIHPGTRDKFLYVPGMDGVRDFGSDREEGTLPLQFLFEGASKANRRAIARNLATWLNVSEAKILVVDDESSKRYMARPIGKVVPEEAIIHGRVEVVFVYPSSYAENVNTKTVTTFPASNAGGEPCPCIITLTMTGAEASVRVTLAATSEFVHLAHSLVIGNVVVINTATHKVTVNAVDARSGVSLDSDYFKLPPGNFTLNVTGAASISVEYRELW